MRVLGAIGAVVGAILFATGIGVATSSLVAAVTFAGIAAHSAKRLPVAHCTEEREDQAPSRAGFPFALSGILYTLQPLVGPLALSLLNLPYQVGQLRLSMTLLLALQTLPLTLNNEVLRTRVYRQLQRSESITELVRGALVASLAIGVGVGLLGVLTAGWLVKTIFGPGFSGTALAFRILCAAFPLFCVSKQIPN